MARVLFILFLFCSVTGMASDGLTKAHYLDDKIRFGQVGILKVSPSFVGWAPRGMILSYETGSGINYWSLNFSVKYFSGFDSPEINSPILEHVKLELQPRLWVTDFMNGFFFAPVLDIYHTGDVAGGITFGGQFYIGSKVLLDAFSGIQTTTPVEHEKDTVFLKFGMNLGFRITK